ncbi:subfamily B ATP-binding cassette protein MsbA [Chitinivorax tropicus]|uniref:Subfamily B ATP-binding cassette protein MsbA n=1 Tax=Chitinivorax tropicus TaxID=714531 RepID=A0A840MJQ5_9PROT|nr:lipid A export permease/ATP-binding protein MsbA [Chitinivorax tropicus]MBB5017057.1 subfamily B ATP-binding cassette protein MsbA [Chitinivorax tropicus]
MSDTNSKQNSRALYFRLLRYARPYWKVFAISLVAMLVASGTEAAFTSLMKPLVDENFVHAKRNVDLYVLPATIICLYLLRAVATFVNDYCSSWLSSRIVTDLRYEMFDRLLTLPVRYFDDQGSGRLMTRITNDVNNVTQAGFNVLTVTVRDGSLVIWLLGLMLYTDWQLTLVCFTVIPIVALSIRITAKRLRGLSHSQQQVTGEVTQVLQEAIEGQRIVKIFGGQEYERARFKVLADKLRRFGVKQTAASSANTGVTQFMIAVALAIIIYFASTRAASGSFTAGSFVAFMGAMAALFAPLKRITGVSDALQRGLAAAESVFELIDTPPEVDSGTHVIQRAKGQIEFRDVGFSYREGERPAVSNITATIRPGQTVALVGGSGSGKTTLVNLLPKFYHPTQGEIWLDGQQLSDIDLKSLRNNISLVSQDVVLFNDTVAANIAYGRDDVSREKIIKAAEMAYARDFIEQMPDGFDTVIGEKGTRLSGGQRQRLAIARALLKDAPILILDEATSALDTQSERQVQAALERLMQNRTTIVIAHRLSTIEKADKIMVMNQGQIVEVGTHAELLKFGGHYALLYQMQFREP